MKKIPLSQGKFALVDDKDYAFLMQWKWCLSSKRYAARNENYYKADGKRTTRTIAMHQVLNKAPKGKLTDHRDGDGLNNQRYNLRTATKSQNMRNRKSSKDSSSKYLGVSFVKKWNKYRASISLGNGKTKSIGGFYKTDKDAAKAYNIEALKYHGDFARLNKIEGVR